jgi:hypothetical protein
MAIGAPEPKQWHQIPDASTLRVENSALRLEALKLAYKTANDIKYFKSSYDYHKSEHDFIEDVNKMLELADINLKYIRGE